MELGIGRQVADYRIEEVIGRGGMGVVYRAVDGRLGRKVALKVIAPEQTGDEEFRRRFISESKAAAAIDHPNVLPVYEAGEADGVLFLCSRLVDGTDLDGLLAQLGALDIPRALSLCWQIAAALDAAHARGLVHRDVKPANILVAHDPGPGTDHCYLTDFGLAQQSEHSGRLTTAGQFVGTLEYVAPEQIQGERVDGAADAYALASLLYTCLSGKPPFVRDSHAALLFAHMNEPPPPVSERVPGVPGEVDAVLARGLAKDPRERFASCSELVSQVSAAYGSARLEDLGPPPGQADAPPSPRAPTLRSKPAPTPTPPTVSVPQRTANRPAGSKQKFLTVGAVVATVAIAAVLLAWLAMPLGGVEDDTEGSVAALNLSGEIASLATTISEGTQQFAVSAEDGASTTDFADLFANAGAVGRSLAQEADVVLQADVPGRTEIVRSATDLERTAEQLEDVAHNPTRDDSPRVTREARRAYESSLSQLDTALTELRDAFLTEGSTEAADSVELSLVRLRESRGRLVEPLQDLRSAL